jgi:hypothetical protein
MKSASISDLKQELTNIPPKQVLEVCIRLAKYKKENKELLTYLLFESHDEQGYIENVKKEIDEYFTELPKPGPYLNKKALRKILKAVNKYSKHTGSRQAEVEMLLYFCEKVKSSGIRINKSVALTNLYSQQIKKINTALQSLHEDLHYDYKKQLDGLTLHSPEVNLLTVIFKRRKN